MDSSCFEPSVSSSPSSSCSDPCSVTDDSICARDGGMISAVGVVDA